MNALLSALTGGAFQFLNPLMLAGLVFLPVLWFLLRVTPPAPRRIRFPAAHFFAGLIPAQQTSSKTPWWILLIRMMIAALIIIALARPVENPGTELPGKGDIRIVIDNGWAAAQNWQATVREAAAIIDRAGRERRAIHIMTTAPEPGANAPAIHGPLSQGQAEAILRGLTPHPWPADYAAATDLAKNADAGLYSFFFSTGTVDEGNLSALLSRLQNQGGLSVMTPPAARLPLLLRPSEDVSQSLAVRIDAPPGLTPWMPVTVQAVSRDGRVIEVQDAVLDAAALPQTITLDVPEALRGQIAQIKIASRESAGTTLAIDDRFHRRAVGIVAPSGQEEAAPLVEASFYITRALSPYADLKNGTVQELVKENPAVIILPDTGAMPPADLNTLESWINKGGLLLRFAGPNMAGGEELLTPVPLRMGGTRALDGSLTWDEPVKLAPFPEHSPFAGLTIPEDLTIARQILADPVEGIDQKSWAMLADGTPLITADRREKGMIVLVHTTATPEWSDLALSGLYVQILRRTVAMAGAQGQINTQGGTLPPISVLDGFGHAQQPGSYVQPIPAERDENMVPDSTHPPGIYGHGGFTASLNLGDALPPLTGLGNLPLGVTAAEFGQTHEKDLMPALLVAALALFFIDWIIMILLQTGFHLSHIMRRSAAIIFAVAFFGLSFPAYAQSSNVESAGALHLAYVITGDSAVDAISRDGLEKLIRVLTRRTSIEPKGVIGVNPESDELAFFPLLYWPISASAPALSSEAVRRVQYYLDHGGTILFDTRDGAAGPRSANGNALRRITANLNIQPLIEMPEDHVLTKTFYLLTGTPGLYEDGTMWVEEESADGRDGVSSVLIGAQDWAGAWSNVNSGDGINIYGANSEEEMSLRFGVNVVMYALTGNYKADQVHLTHILERLGR